MELSETTKTLWENSEEWHDVGLRRIELARLTMPDMTILFTDRWAWLSASLCVAGAMLWVKPKNKGDNRWKCRGFDEKQPCFGSYLWIFKFCLRIVDFKVMGIAASGEGFYWYIPINVCGRWSYCGELNIKLRTMRLVMKKETEIISEWLRTRRVLMNWCACF